MKLSKKRLEEILAFTDEDISDIPELTDEELAKMQPSHFRNPENYRPLKKRISICIDADVLHWYRAGGKGYQTKINQVLREDMLREVAPAYGKVNNSPKDDEDT
jgi:uncharacterized protein (DUF4415 family)